MSEPIFEQDYWRNRVAAAMRTGQSHHAIWLGSPEEWQLIGDNHRRIIADILKPMDSVLDVGCGWGRLLDLMPDWWKGDYIGIDLCRDFVAMARVNHPTRTFLRGDARQLESELSRYPSLIFSKFDYAILCGMEGMLKDNEPDQWYAILDQAKLAATCIISLNYSPDDRGMMYQ